MPLSSDVTLRRIRTPVFPERCVVCLAEKPESTVVASGRATSWGRLLGGVLTPLLNLLPRRGPSAREFRTEAPACAPCAGGARRRRRVRVALEVVVLAGGATAAILLLGERGRGPGRFLALGLVLLVVSPYFVWQALHPPAFDVTVGRDEVDYEFGSRRYAEEFAALNDGEVK